nr:hypothetical protein [uncultured Pseudomonas sp.]
MEVVINESETLVFTLITEAVKFLRDERHKWHWLTQLPPHLLSAAKELQTILLDKPTTEAELSSNTVANGRVQLGTETKPFITSRSEEGKFINEVISNYDFTVGFFSIIYSNIHIKNMAYNNSIISEALRMPKFEYERATAMNLSLTLGNYEKFMGARRRSEFQDVLREQQNDQIEFRAKFNAIADSFQKHMTEQSNQAQLNIETTHKVLHRRIEAINILSKRSIRKVQETAKSAKESHDTALQRLKAADDAYTKNLELKHSVSYWKTRKLTHTLGKYGWLFCVLLSLTLMLAVVGLYFANGGLTAISEHLNKNLPASLIVLSEQSTPVNMQNSSIQSTLSKSEVASIAANITGAILLITILSILIRITLRQFNTHSQYALEAAERVTFIKTYLAMMQEQYIKSDEDRKLIIECIFKSTLGPSTPEIAFSLPTDAIMKVLGEKKTAT